MNSQPIGFDTLNTMFNPHIFYRVLITCIHKLLFHKITVLKLYFFFCYPKYFEKYILYSQRSLNFIHFLLHSSDSCCWSYCCQYFCNFSLEKITSIRVIELLPSPFVFIIAICQSQFSNQYYQFGTDLVQNHLITLK